MGLTDDPEQVSVGVGSKLAIIEIGEVSVVPKVANIWHTLVNKTMTHSYRCFS